MTYQVTCPACNKVLEASVVVTLTVPVVPVPVPPPGNLPIWTDPTLLVDKPTQEPMYIWNKSEGKRGRIKNVQVGRVLTFEINPRLISPVTNCVMQFKPDNGHFAIRKVVIDKQRQILYDQPYGLYRDIQKNGKPWNFSEVSFIYQLTNDGSGFCSPEFFAELS